ncbi:glycosyltransferase family 2 protein [Adlercreutzia faecimuris]|uniref:Glycosyltransferase n=1 Tax=Adlercreutzia faecimuris TaxID=2897341 RepID=A0ABS9WGQ9_9ACTN|nr:glycosyltransferase [Adlercreutzia sp. JBNU-10]MCI2241770.1 glycosyltransferase [Adlercreutzia sp. JBNU-10]
MTNPSLSILIPVYNVEPYLRQCLESIVAQAFEDYEVLCVDDGSTDGSGALLDEFCALNERFVVLHKENGGYGAAVNYALDRARGEYVGIVEPDDYLVPNAYELLMDAARQTGSPDIVKGAYWRVLPADADGKCALLPANYLHCVEKVGAPFTLKDDAEFLYHHPSIWSAVYRKDFLVGKGIRMREIPGAGWADNPFLIETLAQAKSIVYVDEPVYCYREFNVGSSSNVKDPSIIWNRWFDMDEILANLGISDPKILEGHYNRGLYYAHMLEEEFGDDPVARQAITNMVKRMDYNAVTRSSKIGVDLKEVMRRNTGVVRRALCKVLRVFG